MKNYCITVIIPCYNSEKTLSRCIKSIINQTFGFEKIELILYDDASTDNTKDIILKYSEQYENIIPIFSKKNSGNPGKGRNEGINNSSAKYIMFLDHDDEYDRNMCKTLFEEIETENADIVLCSALNYNGLECEKYYLDSNGTIQNNKIIFEPPIYSNARLIWTGIFKKSLIKDNNIKFPEDRLAEDVYFMINYLLNSNTCIYIKEYFGVCRYVQKNSASNSMTLAKLNKIYDLYDELIEICQNKNLNLSEIFKDQIKGTIMQLYSSNMIFEPKNEVINIFKRFEEFEGRTGTPHQLSLIEKIGNYLIINNHYNLAISYFKILYRINNSQLLMKIYKKAK